ncbi:hypothetical protein ACJX0J_036220, partial [Zea mays]
MIIILWNENFGCIGVARPSVLTHMGQSLLDSCCESTKKMKFWMLPEDELYGRFKDEALQFSNLCCLVFPKAINQWTSLTDTFNPVLVLLFLILHKLQILCMIQIR